MKDRLITLELTERDAFLLLKLVRKELEHADKLWQPYWEAQSSIIEQFIEQACLMQSSVWPQEIFGREENEPASAGPFEFNGSF